MDVETDNDVLPKLFDCEKINVSENVGEHYLMHVANTSTDSRPLSVDVCLAYPRSTTSYITETQKLTTADTNVPSDSESDNVSSDSSLATEDLSQEPSFFAAEVDVELCGTEPTERDIEMTICENIRKKLRARVTLPTNDCGGELTSADIDTGVRLPWYRKAFSVVHGFKRLHKSYLSLFPYPLFFWLCQNLEPENKVQLPVQKVFISDERPRTLLTPYWGRSTGSSASTRIERSLWRKTSLYLFRYSL